MNHKQTLERLISFYEKTEGINNDSKRFCFSCTLIEFGLKFTSEQIDKMFSIFTQYQLDMIKSQLDKEEGDESHWY